MIPKRFVNRCWLFLIIKKIIKIVSNKRAQRLNIRKYSKKRARNANYAKFMKKMNLFVLFIIIINIIFEFKETKTVFFFCRIKTC